MECRSRVVVTVRRSSQQRSPSKAEVPEDMTCFQPRSSVLHLDGCFQKLSILIGVSIVFTIHFGGFPPIFGNIHIYILYNLNLRQKSICSVHKMQVLAASILCKLQFAQPLQANCTLVFALFLLGLALFQSYSGIIKLPIWGAFKQCKCIVNLRDFPLIVHCLGW